MIVLEEKLYTSEETADLLGVTSRTLYRYVKRGEIDPETKTKSGTYRFTRQQIYKYLYPDKYEEILEKVKQVESDEGKFRYVPDDDSSDSKNAPSDQTAPKEKPQSPKGENTTPQKEDKASSQDSKTESKDKNENVGNSSTKVDVESIGSSPGDGSNVTSKKKPDFDSELKDLEETIHGDSNKDTSQAKDSPASDSADSKQESTSSDQSASPDLADASKETPKKDTSDDKGGSKDQSQTGKEEWKYYINENKGILDLAKEINSLASETGRKYAATMQGGLSLHHELEEFNVVHFYIENDDLNWWTNHLDLKPADKEQANICLIPSNDQKLFSDAYKLKGLYVVSDQRLIQDLMKHGEKELARSLL